MSKLKRTKSQGLYIGGLFTKQELDKLEELRKKEYTKHEVGNPQFQNADYESYRISIFQKDSPISNFGNRYLNVNALGGYDYSVANNCIKKFIKTQDLNHILHAIEVLKIKTFKCPAITYLLFILDQKNSISLWLGGKVFSNFMQNLFKIIGISLLTDNQEIIKQQKKFILLRTIQAQLSIPNKDTKTNNDSLIYILNLYKKNIKKTKNKLIFKGNIKTGKRESISDINVLIKKHKNTLKTETKKRRIDELNKEIKDLINKKEQIKEYEDKVFKEARKQTIESLKNETGIKIGNTYLKELLSQANRLELK